MHFGLKALLFGTCLSAAMSASAQDALDITVPLQEEDRGQSLAPIESVERIEFEPVLEMPPVSSQQGVVNVSAVKIDGLVALDRSEFSEIITDYAGRSLTSQQMSELASRIAQKARESGYLFANASIPAQPLIGGILRIDMDEGVIDEIRVNGSNDPAIAGMLEPLKNGEPVSIDALERQVLLTDDIPGVIISNTHFMREGNRGILVVEASRQDWFARATLSNDGTRPQGPARARIDIDASGLLLDNDGIALSFSASPFQPEELFFVAARYNVVVNEAGTQISTYGSYSRSEPGSYLSDLDIFGESWRAGVQLRHPILRSRSRGLWLEGDFQVQDLTQDRLGALARDDRIAVARLGAYAFIYGLGGRFRSRVTVSQGLNILGATQTGDPLASRFDGETDFTTLDWWLNYDRSLGGNFSLSLNAFGQFSTAPLFIGESLTLGGNFYVRGYDFSTRVGDQGVMGVGELRYDLQDGLGPIDRLQLYAFADGGTVTNLSDGFGGGSLASSGAGFRADISDTLDLDFEVAVPLTGPRYDTDDESPRVNVSVSKSF